jgi:cytochrome c oxidase cbb3-type subunit III
VNASIALVALTVVSLTVAGRQPSDRPVTTASREQRILAGGVAPPDVTIKAVNPYAGDQASAEQGKALFRMMNCEGCHSIGGEGSWAPSVITRRWRYGGTDAAVFETIFYGRPRGMPAYGGILPPEATWKLVTFLRSLPPPKAVPTQSWQ